MNRALAAAPIFLFAACGGTAPDDRLDPVPDARFSLKSALPQAQNLEGVAIDPSSGKLVFIVPEVGIVESDRSGKIEKTLKFGENGLDQWAYTDVAKLADGSYVLTTFGDTMKYDPIKRELSTYFCLVPSIDPMVTENYAVAVDPDNGRIFAAPAVFDMSAEVREPVSNDHVQYRVSDGEFIEAHDVKASNVVARGIAFDKAGAVLYAVEGTKLHAFDLGGRMIKSWPLDGVQDASGLALDGAARKLIVTDKVDLEVVTIDLAGL